MLIYITYIFLFIYSIILTYYLTPIFRDYALSHDITDKPDNNIKTHKRPTAYLGGLSIFLSILIGVILISLIDKFFINLMTFKTFVTLWQVILCSSLIMILGLIDDLKDLSPYLKLFVQLLVALIIINYDIKIQIKYFPEWGNSILTVFWLVLITNATNLIDIMDGLCPGVLLIAGITFIITGYLTNNILVMLLSILISGSLISFLKYNYNPAKIFLGDSGSLMLGFIMGVISISMSYTEINITGIFLPIIILGIPLYDTFLITYFRIKAGKSPIHGSNDHFALRLRHLGFTVKSTVNLIYLISLILSISAILILISNIFQAIITYLILILISLVFAILLSKIEPN